MKRIPILLASLLLLAGCTAPAQSTASAPAETPAAPVETPADPANAGDVHMLTNRYDGGQYTTCIVPSGSYCVSKIDYATATAHNMCQIPGCQHATSDCPVLSAGHLLVDGDTLWYPYIVHSDSEYAYALAAYTDGVTPPAHPLFAVTHYQTDLVYSVNVLAADEEFLYFVGNSSYAFGGAGPNGAEAYLFSAEKSTGLQAQRLRLDTLLPGQNAYWTLSAAEGRSLYLQYSLSSDNTSGVYRYDLDTRQCSPLLQLTQNADALGTPLCSPQVVYDLQQGSITAVDVPTGQSTLLTDTFPTGDSYTYAAASFRDGWVLSYSLLKEQDAFTHQFFRAPDGTLTELPQQMYCDARGTTPVNILDIQNGLVFLQYAYDTVPVSSCDYEGNPYTYDTYLPVYGIIPLQELLAGSQNYRKLTFD